MQITSLLQNRFPAVICEEFKWEYQAAFLATVLCILRDSKMINNSALLTLPISRHGLTYTLI